MNPHTPATQQCPQCTGIITVALTAACLLDPEPHPSLAAAVARGAQAPWTATVWIIIDPSGHVAAHRARSIGGHS